MRFFFLWLLSCNASAASGKELTAWKLCQENVIFHFQQRWECSRNLRSFQVKQCIGFKVYRWLITFWRFRVNSKSYAITAICSRALHPNKHSMTSNLKTVRKCRSSEKTLISENMSRRWKLNGNYFIMSVLSNFPNEKKSFIDTYLPPPFYWRKKIE